MLSLTSEFTEKDIARIRVLKEDAVWLLAGNGQDLVIKWEMFMTQGPSSEAFNNAKKAMGVIDSNVKGSKRLTDNEKSALRQFVLRQKSLVQFTTGNRIPGATANLEVMLGNGMSKGALWYKMPYVPVSTLGGALQARWGAEGATDFQANDGPLLKFQQTLLAPGGLEALGRIIAADMFSNNHDRVMPSEEDGTRHTYTYAGYQFGFKTIQNISNLMVTGHGSAKTVSGMDFADPSSAELKNADYSLTMAEQSLEWYGYIITDRARRKKFAEEIIDDLESIFQAGRKKGFRDRLPGKRTILGQDAPKRLERGMVDGAHRIAQYYIPRMNGKQYSALFKDRVLAYQKVV